MKKLLVIGVALLLLLVCAVPVSADNAATADLVIGRNIENVAGTVDVVYNGELDQVSVTYAVNPALNGGWSITETHIYIDTKAPTKSAPGKFAYTAAAGEDPYLWTAVIDLELEPGQDFYVAAYATLTKTEMVLDPVTGEPVLDENGQPVMVVLEECGWAKVGNDLDIPIPPGKNPATYFVLSDLIPI